MAALLRYLADVHEAKSTGTTFIDDDENFHVMWGFRTEAVKLAQGISRHIKLPEDEAGAIETAIRETIHFWPMVFSERGQQLHDEIKSLRNPTEQQSLELLQKVVDFNRDDDRKIAHRMREIAFRLRLVAIKPVTPATEAALRAGLIPTQDIFVGVIRAIDTWFNDPIVRAIGARWLEGYDDEVLFRLTHLLEDAGWREAVAQYEAITTPAHGDALRNRIAQLIQRAEGLTDELVTIRTAYKQHDTPPEMSLPYQGQILSTVADVLESGGKLADELGALDELLNRQRTPALAQPVEQRQVKKMVRQQVKAELKTHLDDDYLVAAYAQYGSYRKAAKALSVDGREVSRDKVKRAVDRAGGIDAIRRDREVGDRASMS